MLDYEAADGRPGDRALPVSARRLDRPRELKFEAVPIPESDDHAEHDDALERMLPRYIGACDRLLRRVPLGAGRPGEGAARALAPGRRRLAGIAQLAPPAPPSSASTSTAPSARCATRRAEVCSRSPARAARRPGPTTPPTSCRRRSSTPSRRCSSTRTSAPSSRVPTSSRSRPRCGRAADGWPAGWSPHSRWTAMRPRSSSTSSSWTSTGTAAPTRCCAWVGGSGRQAAASRDNRDCTCGTS